jgi:Uma2 family endonuclease
MPITINPPDGPFSVYDVDTMPDIGYRIEVHEGKLVMMSPATLWHSRTIHRLVNALEANGRPVGMEVGVKRSAHSTRVADVAVFHEEQTDNHQSYWAPKEIALVIEVVSESSEEDDRVIKPRWYAREGIPEYWRVEEDEDGDAVIFQYQLARTAAGEATYVETGVTKLSLFEAGGTA